MDIQSRCGGLKEKIKLELQEAAGTWERDEILIASLYELSRSVFPGLGQPDRSKVYQDRQMVVLDLISFIAISLVRNGSGDSRAIAVLIEIGEECLDPLLKKKLSVYAQELLSKRRSESPGRPQDGRRRIALLFGLAAVSLLALYLGLPVPLHSGGGTTPLPGTCPVLPVAVPQANQAAVPQPEPAGGANPAGTSRERDEAVSQESPAQAALAAKGGVPAEQSTKVRITNNQVLVPVLLKNGGETVRVELVLDTGSTRTSIHEGLAGRLRIDLRQARLSQSEVADGSLMRSRSVTIDSLAVGPFSLASAEVDFIPYKGTEGWHDGLLGMDFLGRHRYQIDMDHELIRWF